MKIATPNLKRVVECTDRHFAAMMTVLQGYVDEGHIEPNSLRSMDKNGPGTVILFTYKPGKDYDLLDDRIKEDRPANGRGIRLRPDTNGVVIGGNGGGLRR